MSAIEKITAQQQGKEGTDVWMVGQQLKDILRADPSLEEIVDKDLDVKGMSLANCAKRIKAFADEQHKKVKGSCVCVPPAVAEDIIREFYGLPVCPFDEAPPVSKQDPVPTKDEDDSFDFSNFL